MFVSSRNGEYCKILTKKETIRKQGFTLCITLVISCSTHKLVFVDIWES